MESRFPGWPEVRSEECPSKSVVKTQNLGLAEFTEDGVNRVEGGVNFLSAPVKTIFPDTKTRSMALGLIIR